MRMIILSITCLENPQLGANCAILTRRTEVVI
jgi:hypothetical protein